MNNTLLAIRNKVRKLTRSPSPSQLTDDEINNYINTFILYDLPQQLRLFSLRRQFTFYTKPYIDTYTTSDDPSDQLYNFKNRFLSIHEPVYIGGTQALYTQNRELFYGYYPRTDISVDTLIRGNGAFGPFAGTLPSLPVLRGSLSFNCLSVNDDLLMLKDQPIENSVALGLIVSTAPTPVVLGSIDYLTGDFQITFTANTKINSPINAVYQAYLPSKPTGILYHGGQFVLRPVPDKSYPVNIEVTMPPTELLADNSVPELEQWWQWIAFEATKKVFEDRLDQESLSAIVPSLLEQQINAFRPTIMQKTNERTPTIFSSPRSKIWPF